MSYSRRSLILSMVAGASTLATVRALGSQPQHPPVEPRPSPNTPDPAHPWGLSGHQDKPEESRAMNKQNQAEVRASVQKLYTLVSELKDEVERSNASTVLSVAVVKKSQQIEKLAKHVKELAKG